MQSAGDMPGVMHAYARERLDWSVKMAPVARAILGAGATGGEVERKGKETLG
jgi:hypothetical protein